MKDIISYYLPHKYPFLLIDRVIDHKKGEYAICRKCVSNNEPFFQGHFPNSPVVPGVLLVEMLAQTAGIAIGIPANQGVVGVLAGINKAKFKNIAKPGDILTLKSTVTANKMNVFKIECIASNEENIVCQCELKIVVVEDETVK